MGTRFTRRQFLAGVGAGTTYLALMNPVGCGLRKRTSKVRLLPGASSTSPNDVWAFRSRPDLDPPVVEVVEKTHDDTAPGYIFVTPDQGDEGQGGALIFDNGLHLGEHRLQGKGTAYEEAVHIPLLVRGPSVPKGATRSQMVLNNDLAPTFADLNGVQVPSFVDGRSFKPLLSAKPPVSWRSAFLIEHRRSAENADTLAIPDYDAVRTSRYLYGEYPTTGEKELYDLGADPHELTNLYASVSPKLLGDLQTTLDDLKRCAGEVCKTAENGL